MSEFNAKFLECQELLASYLDLVNQDDKKVIERFDNILKSDDLNSFIMEGLKLNPVELAQFDADRDHTLIKNSEWLSLVEKIQNLKKFPKISLNQKIKVPYGNKKKLHEFQTLHPFLADLSLKEEFVDFGGGLGNLSLFMAKEFDLNPVILEANQGLCEKGEIRLHKEEIKGKYICKKITRSEKINELELIPFAIGLHTCGSFAVNMLKTCDESNVKSLLSFGCCYSKIENDEYQISSLADKGLKLNQRVLSAGTLSFSSVEREIYDFRVRIQDYKYSFYHFLKYKTGNFEFMKMGNSRRKLYDKSFSSFAQELYRENFPDLELPNEEEFTQFYKSELNQKLLNYFQVYYALARYIGELVELYILYDRACFLIERGYQVEIIEFFDPRISPRNKGIYAYLP